MLNYFKFIEVIISLQSLVISAMLPVFISFPFINKFKYNFEIPITWQIPTIIIISLIFQRRIVFIALSIYLLLGLFIIPVFHQGGSLGYLLTPNFGYLIGMYPLIKIIDNLRKKNKILINEFLKAGILAISSMHITGIIYSLILMIFYKQINIFLYNFGYYTLGKIWYHFLMLIPISLLLKSINSIKYRAE